MAAWRRCRYRCSFATPASDHATSSRQRWFPVKPARWLLLRGLAREQRHWGAFRAALASQGAEVQCLDLPGAGTENDRKSPASIRGITEDLRERWRRTPREGAWGLCAVSLGGMVAMDWCGRHPDDFDALVLVNTSAANLSVPWRRMNLRVLP